MVVLTGEQEADSDLHKRLTRQGESVLRYNCLAVINIEQVVPMPWPLNKHHKLMVQ